MGCSQSKNVINIDTPNELPKQSQKYLPKQLKPTITHIENVVRHNSITDLNENLTQNSIQTNQLPNEINSELNSEKPNFLKGFVRTVSSRSFRARSSSSSDSHKAITYKGNFYDIASELKNTEIFDSINWIDKYKPSIKEFEYLKNDLNQEYKERVKYQMHTYFSNIQITIEKSTDGTLFSHKPESIFYVINSFIDIVKIKLSNKYAKEIMTIGLQLLRDIQRDTYDYIKKDSLNEEDYCVIINDSARLKKICQISNDLYSLYESDEITNMIFDAIITELLIEYDSIITTTIGYLIKKILKDLESDYFSKLFTPEWETSDNLIKIFMATIKECFDVVLPWIDNEYSNIFVCEIMKQILYKYISGLKNKKNKSFINELLSTNKILRDKQTFKDFFQKYCEKKAPVINNNLEKLLDSIENFNILDALCKLMMSRNFDGSKKEIDLLCAKFGLDGVKFAKMAFNCNPLNTKKLIL